MLSCSTQNMYVTRDVIFREEDMYFNKIKHEVQTLDCNKEDVIIQFEVP